MKHGLFITFEGGEGAGKSTQIRRLADNLKKSGFRVLVTLEPGGTQTGEKIREVLLNPKNRALTPRAELLMYQADRAQHADEIVRPHLEKGFIVLCDRHGDSSTVYQGYCRGLGVKWVETLNSFATDKLVPDITFLLDIPENIGRDRIRKRIRDDVYLKGTRRAVKLDRLEREKRDFHRKVRKGFLSLAKKNAKRFRVVDATQSEEAIAAELITLLGKKLKTWKRR